MINTIQKATLKTPLDNSNFNTKNVSFSFECFGDEQTSIFLETDNIDSFKSSNKKINNITPNYLSKHIVEDSTFILDNNTEFLYQDNLSLGTLNGITINENNGLANSLFQTVTCISAGYSVGNTSSVKLADGIEHSTNATGLNTVLIRNNVYVESKTFNTHNSSNNFTNLGNYINTLQKGDIFIIVARDQAQNSLTQIYIDAMTNRLKASTFSSLGYRQSYILISIVDCAKIYELVSAAKIEITQNISLVGQRISPILDLPSTVVDSKFNYVTSGEHVNAIKFESSISLDNGVTWSDWLVIADKITEIPYNTDTSQVKLKLRTNFYGNLTLDSLNIIYYTDYTTNRIITSEWVNFSITQKTSSLIYWDEILNNQSIVVETRTSSDGTELTANAWEVATNNSVLPNVLNNYVQYKLTLSTTNSVLTPIISNINIILNSDDINAQFDITKGVVYWRIRLAKADTTDYLSATGFFNVKYSDVATLYQYENISLSFLNPIDKRALYQYTNIAPPMKVDDRYTKLLLHMDRPNYNTIFTDEAGHNLIEKYGNTCTIPSVGPFEDNCGKFNSNYLLLPSTNFVFGTNDFTMECWVNLNTMPTSDAWSSSWSSHMSVMSVGTPGKGDGCGLVLGKTKLILHSNDSQIVNGIHNITVGSWHHIAATRNGNQWRVFVDGKVVGTGTSNVVAGIGSGFYIGGETGEGAYVNGYLDEIRVSIGIARWTSDFTTSLIPYSVDEYTRLLLHMNEFPFIDECGQTVTNMNNVSLPLKSKFGKYCGYFDGNGDYLKIINSNDWNFNDGDSSLNVVWGSYNGTYASNKTIMDSLFANIASPYTTTINTSINWGRSSSLAKPSYLVEDYFIWKAYGYLYCPEDGIYTFSVDSDDFSDLLIDDVLVASEYGTSGTGVSNSWSITGTITLTTGWHSITARMQELNSGDGFGVGWKKPSDSSFSVISNKYFSTYIPSNESKNFTIDFWIRPTAIDADRYIVSQYYNDSNFWGIKYNLNGAIGFYAVENGVIAANYLTNNSVLTLNEWNHIAIIRNDTIDNCLKIYINGKDSTQTTPLVDLKNKLMPTVNGSLFIGQKGNNTSYYLGYMDEVRISKGIARWTSDFTPYVKAYGEMLKKRFVYAQIF